jgi:hypothetical protein
VDTKAGAVSLYDFSGDGHRRMLVGMLLVSGRSWFVKMLGDAAPVETSRADFVKLLESLRLSPAPGSRQLAF